MLYCKFFAFNRTPLMAASCEGTQKMVRLLLEYGGDPLLKDNYGQTAADFSLQNQSESYTFCYIFLFPAFYQLQKIDMITS